MTKKKVRGNINSYDLYMNMFNEQVTVIPKPDINLNLEWTYHCPRITKDTEFMNSNE